MRTDKIIILLNSKTWLIDFRRNRIISLPKGMHRAVTDLTSLFGDFDHMRAFNLWRRNIKYKDYSEPSLALREDFLINQARHEISQQPPLELSSLYKSVPEINLKNTNDPSFSICSKLLHFSLRRIETRRFYKDTIQIRPSPSVGARHGIDVFVHINGVDYYYSSDRHSLLRIDTTIRSSQYMSMTFFCRSDVYMWRYPYGSCLLDVYWDFGHILGNIALASSIVGIPTPRLENSKFEELTNPPGSMTLGTLIFNKV